MNLPGMFVESKTEGSQTYQRLYLPECGVTGEIGAPELPVVLSQLIAVPECDNIIYSVAITFFFDTFASINNQQNIIDNEVEIKLL